MGLLELILAVVIAAKLFGVPALAGVSWGTIAMYYGGVYAVGLLIALVCVAAWYWVFER